MALILTNDEQTEGYWICYTCGIDIPYEPYMYLNRKNYDEHWNSDDERKMKDELDDYFYQKYPEFRDEDET